jgi:hypothetical protein
VGRPPIGTRAMTNAEHQARHRARHGEWADPGNAARQQRWRERQADKRAAEQAAREATPEPPDPLLPQAVAILERGATPSSSGDSPSIGHTWMRRLGACWWRARRASGFTCGKAERLAGQPHRCDFRAGGLRQPARASLAIPAMPRASGRPWHARGAQGTRAHGRMSRCLRKLRSFGHAARNSVL